MNPITNFTVLIERRALKYLVKLMTVLTMIFSLLTGQVAVAAPGNGNGHAKKIARDLQDALDAPTTANVRWAREINGQRHVQVVIMSSASDPEMTNLRAHIKGLGGSVHVAMPGLRAVTATLPAAQVAKLAERSDVFTVAPNRATARTASTVESITGAVASNVRTHSSGSTYTGLTGIGIGIAILDSGVMRTHDAFDNGAARVKRNVNMLNTTVANWTTGAAGAASLMPGSSALTSYEASIANDSAVTHDKYGHGTHVTSVAAGQYYGAKDAAGKDLSGVAPKANIYDVKVLNDYGFGTVSDALEGIQWVIYHAKEYNIRVLNLSLASNSAQTWQTDPLCIAARSATAAGITVVVAAGNFGMNILGKDYYGTISSPGNDPSVITVGSANFKDTLARSDDVVNNFSSRGPTRGSYVDAAGVRQIDSLLKPDLVAPGNKIVGAAATASNAVTWNTLASSYFSALVTPLGFASYTTGETQMVLSGTSVAAPAVSGAVALMLEANPGLTPPLIKAMLQYSAQPLPNANLLQQGAGLLNVDGAVALAKVLRTDIASAVNAGTLTAGSSLLASGKSMPSKTSSLNGASFNWSRVAVVGGSVIVSGDALFTQFQPIYDPRFTWSNGVVRKRVPTYWSGIGIAANTYVQSFSEVSVPTGQKLVTGSVVNGKSLVGTSSMLGKTGVFIPTATLSGWFVAGSGTVMSEGVVMSEGLVFGEK